MNYALLGAGFLAVSFGLTRLNIWLGRRDGQKLVLRFGSPGIGQRDDYDSDIRSPRITAMRNAQRARDVDAAIRIINQDK